MLGSLGVEFSEVELEFLSLQDVTVTPTALSGPGRDGSEQPTLPELGLEVGVDLGVGLAGGEGTLNVSGLLDLAGGGGGGVSAVGGGGRLGTAVDRGGVMSLVPLPERGSVDLDDSALDEGLGSEKLVVRGVVDHIDNPGLPGGALRSPRKVSAVQPHSPVLDVTTANPDLVDPLGSKLGHGGLTTQLELPLLAVVGSASAGCGALVARVS